jgi:hypothetical protein
LRPANYCDMLLRKTPLSKVSYRICSCGKLPSQRWVTGTVTVICSCGKLLFQRWVIVTMICSCGKLLSQRWVTVTVICSCRKLLSQKGDLSVPLLWYALAENSSLKNVFYRYRYCDMLLRKTPLSKRWFIGTVTVICSCAVAENSSLKKVIYRYRYCDMLLRKTPLSKRWFIGTVTVICSCGKLLSQKGDLSVPLLWYALAENSSLKKVSYPYCPMLLWKTPLSKASYCICRTWYALAVNSSLKGELPYLW